MEAADLQRVGEVYCMPGPLDVEDAVALVVGRHVVDGSEVEEVLNVAAQPLDVGVGQAERCLVEVTYDRMDAPRASPSFDEGVQALSRRLSDKDVDVALALQQLLDQVAADEAGRAGHEVGHGCPPPHGCPDCLSAEWRG